MSTATQVVFAYNPSLLDGNGNPRVVMVVIPDFDSQLTDTAYNPKGCVQMRVPIAQYRQNSSANGAPVESYLQSLIPGYRAPVVAQPT